MQSSKSIPLVAPLFSELHADAVRDQVLSGFVGPGQRAQIFAKALGEFVKAPFCLLTVSGTTALSVAAISLGLKAGDEILVPAYGVISTINAFASIGLHPRLVDIDQTGCMSPDALEQAITENTKAVCFVNFSGYTGPHLTQVKALCDRKGLPLIEDAACALGHTYQGVHAGNFGTIGIYSFSVPKVLTTGQGGVIVTSNKELFDAAGAFIDQGDLEWRKTGINRGIGANLRFNDVLAALGFAQLVELKERLQKRRAVYQVLLEELAPFLFTVPGDEAPLHNVVFTYEPALLVEKLKQQGITATCLYRTLCEHPAYSSLKSAYPNADFWTKHAVYLPFGMALVEEDASFIARTIKETGIELMNRTVS